MRYTIHKYSSSLSSNSNENSSFSYWVERLKLANTPEWVDIAKGLLSFSTNVEFLGTISDIVGIELDKQYIRVNYNIFNIVAFVILKTPSLKYHITSYSTLIFDKLSAKIKDVQRTDMNFFTRKILGLYLLIDNETIWDRFYKINFAILLNYTFSHVLLNVTDFLLTAHLVKYKHLFLGSRSIPITFQNALHTCKKKIVENIDYKLSILQSESKREIEFVNKQFEKSLKTNNPYERGNEVTLFRCYELITHGYKGVVYSTKLETIYRNHNISKESMTVLNDFKGNEDTDSFTLKVVFSFFTKDSLHSFLLSSIQFSQKMSELNIGPTVYLDQCFIGGGVVLFDSVYEYKYGAYIVMEKYDSDMFNYSRNNVVTDEHLIKIENLVTKMISNGVVCSDIKLQNIVIKTIGSSVKIALIDFDNIFCCSKIGSFDAKEHGSPCKKTLITDYLIKQLVLTQISLLSVWDEIYMQITDKGRFSEMSHDVFISDIQKFKVNNYFYPGNVVHAISEYLNWKSQGIDIISEYTKIKEYFKHYFKRDLEDDYMRTLISIYDANSNSDDDL